MDGRLDRVVWPRVARCKQLPSSVLFASKQRGNWIVFSTGSCNVHVFQAGQGVGNGVVKFTSPVNFIIALTAAHPTVLCFLGDGRLTALHIEKVIASLSDETDPFTGDEEPDDVFSMLLGTGGLTLPPGDDERRCLDSEEYCVTMPIIADNPLGAASLGTRLMVLTKSRTGSTAITVYDTAASRPDVSVAHAPVWRCEIATPPSSSSSSAGPGTVVPRPPILYLDTCDFRGELFCPFLTPDQLLTGSAVTFIGTQAGHVYCFSNRLNPTLFYSLHQAVVGLHALTSSPAGTSHSALAFIGQRGKVVVCLAEGPYRAGLRFSELQLNGPILCSTVIGGDCLLYGTPDGVYSVNVSSSCRKDAEHTTFEAAFQCPQKVSLIESHHLLELPPTAPGRSGREVLSVSLSGIVRSFLLVPESKQLGSRTSDDLKNVLRRIECVARQAETLSRSIAGVDASLGQLNEALSLAGALSGSACTPPLSCQLRPTLVPNGASPPDLFLQLTLEYGQKRPLGRGWSLLVNTHVAGGRRRTEVVSLEGLSQLTACDYSRRLPIPVHAAPPLELTAQCLVHFVHPRSAAAGGVSFELNNRILNASHFLCPLRVSATLQEIASSHCVRFTEGPGESDAEETLDRVVLRSAGLDRGCCSRRGRQEAQVLSIAYNGLPVSITADVSSGTIEISIRSSSKALAMELAGCLLRNKEETLGPASVAAFRRELAGLQGEIASGSASHSVAISAYHLYCKLRGVTAT